MKSTAAAFQKLRFLCTCQLGAFSFVLIKNSLKRGEEKRLMACISDEKEVNDNGAEVRFFAFGAHGVSWK